MKVKRARKMKGTVKQQRARKIFKQAVKQAKGKPNFKKAVASYIRHHKKV